MMLMAMIYDPGHLFLNLFFIHETPFLTPLYIDGAAAMAIGIDASAYFPALSNEFFYTKLLLL